MISNKSFSCVERLKLSLLFVGKKTFGVDNVATGDGSERFAVREAQKLHFLGE